MNSPISYICEFILAVWVSYNLIGAYISKDKAKAWSPISVISLTYAYYCLIPFWLGTKEQYVIDESLYNGHLFHLAAFLSFAATMIGFKYSRTKQRFSSYVDRLTDKNVGIIGIIVTIIGFIGYGSVRGFHFTIAATGSSDELAIGGLVYYAMMTLDMLAFSAALLLLGYKNSKRNIIYIVFLWLIFVQFLIAGARWRIVVAGIALLAVYYLYPKVKRINLAFLIPLAIVAYLGFSAMDQVRVRGLGIDVGAASTLKIDDIKEGSNENYDVYRFSLWCIDKINSKQNYIYFQPALTALLMPIPRSLYQDKPDGRYIKEIEKSVGASGGSAYLCFVEGFYSFGWFGVILFGWFLGWLARVFWDFYDRNRQSKVAVVTLGVFSGLCYVFVSRGYIAASFTTIVLALFLPLWIIKLYNRIFGIQKK